jgi:carbon-monoxide dehydrogenase iron sulfur subunit
MAERVVEAAEKAASPESGAKGRIVFDFHFCRTCRVCEAVCSIHKEGQARPAVARIAILFDEFATIDPLSARICAQCEAAPCIEACRVGAMSRHPGTGAVLIAEDKCIGCMRCNKECPWEIPQQHPDRRKAIKCDLCYDRAQGPLCVQMCPLSGKALRYEPEYYGGGNGHEHV